MDEGGLRMNMYDICLLHARSDRSLRSFVATHLEKAQITMMEWLLLGVIASGSSKGVSMSDIAKALHVTLPQVTALVNKLLPLKLVKQKSASSDRRSRLVTLTNKGELVLSDAGAQLDTAKKQLFNGMSEQQIQDYVLVLQRMATTST